MVANECGYDHALLYDHVVGADETIHQDWWGAYNVRTPFHEPMVLFGYLAALTGMEMLAGIIVLPQRQTALVAKQAAEVDMLTGGKFRLGVAIGWNPVEYQALGKDFSNRGQRIEEQVAILRQLWSERSVTFQGRFEEMPGVGLAPRPVQRPIPIWFGGQSPIAYRRAGRLGDGWIPEVYLGPELTEAQSIVNQAASEAGRDPETIGMQGRVRWGTGGVSQIVDDIGRWGEVGATHVAINTMMAPSGEWRQDAQTGLSSVQEHLDVLHECADALKLTPRR
jgi:probable F420-dependent oxidoreductase